MNHCEDLPPASQEEVRAFRHHLSYHPRGAEVDGCRFCEARKEAHKKAKEADTLQRRTP